MNVRMPRYELAPVTALFLKTRGKAHVQHQTVKSDFQNRGRAPPGLQKGKAADARDVHGLNGVATLQSSNPVTLAHTDSEIKRSRADWRIFYDNARGNVDHAIKELYRAWGNGLLTDAEAVEIEAGLRSQQAWLQPCPTGPGGIAAILVNGKSKLALGWPRRRPRRSPDREKSRQRARMLGGSPHASPCLRRGDSIHLR
jgi:hypothetical protein